VNEDETARKRFDAEVKFFGDIFTLAFDRASAYLNVVKIGGYGAFFAALGLLGDQLTDQQKLWSAGFMFISITLFVFFEVYKGFTIHKYLLKLADVAQALPETLEARKEAFDRARLKAGLEALSVWRFVFPTSLITGAIGALILFASIVYGILR